MEARVYRVLIWGGPGMIIIWLGAFVAVAGFIPPSDPQLSAQQVVDFYADNTTLKQFGLVLSMAGCALLVPWAVAVSGHIKRIEGAKPLADLQMVCCALLSLEFIIPIGIWMGISYRFEGREPEITRALHDVSWILFMTVIWSLFVQLIAIGWAILIDRSDRPALPRWMGYLTFWVALAIIPAGIVLFFKDGPFAWNGLFGIYVPIAVFVVWIFSLTIYIHRDLTREIEQKTAEVEI